MCAFAANSLLAREVLGKPGFDATWFGFVRIASAALALVVLLWVTGKQSFPKMLKESSWFAALMLGGYVLTFSDAYRRIGAATGALVLFGFVQLTTWSVALRRGERPGGLGFSGLLLSLIGLVVLMGPRASRPDPIGFVLMAVAGICWATYSLMGRKSSAPLQATAGNFARAIPLALVFFIVEFVANSQQGVGISWNSRGMGFALISGVITSGLGYALWYSVLPSLTRTQSGVLQLLPAPIATVGAALLLGERITSNLFWASSLILFGVVLALQKRK